MLMLNQILILSLRQSFSDSITSFSANLNASLVKGGTNVTQSGFEYTFDESFSGTNPIYTTTLGPRNTGPFNQTITDLIPNITYYFRAYAVDSMGTSRGSVLSFTTSINISVTTLSSDTISFTSETLNGSITNYTGIGVTDYGFEYDDSYAFNNTVLCVWI